VDNGESRVGLQKPITDMRARGLAVA
jgi:hypothetical protein